MLVPLVAATFLFASVAAQERPAYVKPCARDDPKIDQCFIRSLMHLSPFMAKGIPEIDLPSLEPFRLQELSLALTTGPNGYRITLKDMDVFGMSNLTVNKLKLSKNGSPYEAVMRFPKLTMSSEYKSSGVLLILPASGSGVFHCTLGDTIAKATGNIKYFNKNGKEYLNIETLNIDFTFNKVSMRVEKAHKNNPILREATNLFLRENGNEVVELMKPQMAKQLAAAALNITNTILKNTPIELYYI